MTYVLYVIDMSIATINRVVEHLQHYNNTNIRQSPKGQKLDLHEQ